MKYLNAIKQLLIAISEDNRMEALIWTEELGNLLMDKVPISDTEAEIADAMINEFDMDFKEVYD